MIRPLVLKIAELSGIFSLSRYIHRNQPLILMYHRVIDQHLLPGVPPSSFEKQLRHLKNNFRIVPMHVLAEELRTGHVEPYSVAITFDDGHSDFYSNAWPILKEYNLPAALYVTTGFIDQTCWLWPDLLKYILMKTTAKSVIDENLGNLNLDQSSLLHSWSKLGDYCLTLQSNERWSFIHQLANKLDIEVTPFASSPFNSVTWDQLREMTREGLEVGSHTVSHPILSSLDKQKLISELSISKQRIREELGVDPAGICYPNGMPQDTSKLVELEASKIYKYGLVAYPAKPIKSHLFHIGRHGAPASYLTFKQTASQLLRERETYGEYK